MKQALFLLSAAILTIFTQCDTVRNLPTNTSGGVFSLNGQWQLASTSDTKNMEGTVITVVPGFSEATVRTLPAVNSSCVRERDAMWRNVKRDPNGGFVADVLLSACTGSPQFGAGTITVVGNDEIRVRTLASGSTELLQTWRRVSGN